MNRRMLTALICAALCLLGAARGEGMMYQDDDMSNRCHLSPRCALAWRDTAEIPLTSWGEESGHYPCPACVSDETPYPGVEAWERGGTVILRVSDAWIEARLAEASEPKAAPEALLHDGGTQDADLARLLHGQAYLDCLNAAAAGETQTATAFVPQCADDDLLMMSSRHLGGAWLLALRPEKAGRDALAKTGKLSLSLRLWRLGLKIHTYPAGSLFEQTEDTACRELALALEPQKTEGEIALRRNDVEEDGYSFYILADGDVYTLVYRERQYDGENDAHRRAELLEDAFWLNGYRDGEDAVFVFAVTEGELSAMQSLYPSLYAVPVWREDNGEPADAAQLAADYVPVSEATRPDGTSVALNASEYPVGTPFISATLTRPEGGVAEYGCETPLQRLHNGQWLPVGDANLRGRVNGDENRIRAGWFCDSVNLVWPIERFGALEEGLYRVMAGDDGQGRALWLEFRVREGAPDPVLPETKPHRWPGFDFPAHTPAHADAAAYNSCTDNSRVYHGSGRSTLLAGGVVYELRGIDESWGWGISSHYSLFACPEGQPQRTAQLIDDIDASDLRLYDLGDGLLLLDNDNTFFRCDLDGGNLRTLGRAFGEDAPSFFAPEAEEAGRCIQDALPVGDGLYLATVDGVWHTGLDAIAPKLVYRAEDFIQNNFEGGRMVYADGRLFVADDGLVALDTASRDADGLLRAQRLTRGGDGLDGDCGLGCIVLNGRLYCWDAQKEATVSMNLDGGDVRKVSKERFWFSAATPSGVVLALTGSEPGLFGDERTAAAFYFPKDADNPDFDPDHCQTRPIAPGDYDYILGDALVHTDANGTETREALSAIGEPAPELPAPAAPKTADIGPGEDLSFLRQYADAVRVGDWFLACVKATAPEEEVFDTDTRNTTAPWVLLNDRGEVLAEDLYWWPEDYEWALHPRPFEGFEEGVDTAVLRVGQKYGLIDRSGKIVVPPEYDMIFGFDPGDASTPAEKDGKWGFIDAAGNVVAPLIYDSSMARFVNGCTVAERGGKQLLLGEDGTELLPPEFEEVALDDDAAFGTAHRGENCLLFDRRGRILFERALGEDSWIFPGEDAALPLCYWDGGAEKYGYLNWDGSEALPPIYDEAVGFGRDGTAWVRLNGLCGLMRPDGSFALPAEYESLGALREGLRVAEKGGLWGYLDGAGNVAIPFQFAWADDFENGYADAVPARERWEGEAPRTHGLIDPAGRWVIEPRTCDYIAVGPDGVAVACDYENEACFRVTEAGAEEIFGLPRTPKQGGRLPHEDAAGLARLSGEKTLKKRVSEEARLPHLDGEARLYPLYAAYVEAVYPKDVVYEGYDYRLNPVLTVSGGDRPWQRLSDGDADIIFVAAPDPEDGIWATLAARGQEPEFIPLCRDAVVFLASADNPVDGVTDEQLRQLYAGEIADWAALGAAGPGAVTAYQDSEGSEARAAFERICAFSPLAEAPRGVTGYDSWAAVANIGATPYRGLPGALGYALRSQCGKLPEGVKLLSVNGAGPTDDAVASGAYPYAETLYAVALKGNKNPNVRALLDWIQGDQGRELAEGSGFAGMN